MSERRDVVFPGTKKKKKKKKERKCNKEIDEAIDFHRSIYRPSAAQILP